MKSSIHQGWLVTTISSTGVRIMSHESGKGCAVYVRGIGPSAKITVYRPNGHYDNFTNIETALKVALVN